MMFLLVFDSFDEAAFCLIPSCGTWLLFATFRVIGTPGAFLLGNVAPCFSAMWR